MKALELFHFVIKTHAQRGWGRALRTAVAGWYVTRPVREVAADILKCPGHQGWTHRDLVRLAHPKPATPAQNALLQWAVDGELGHFATPDLVTGELRQVYAVQRLKGIGEEGEALNLIEGYGLTHEMIPYPWRRSPAVWETLLTSMSYIQIVENLSGLSDSGLLAQESAATALVVGRLIDRRRALHSRLSCADLVRVREIYARHVLANRVIVDALDYAIEILRN